MHSYCALLTPTSQKPTASLCAVLVGTSQFQRMSPPIMLVPPCFWWLDQAWTVQTTGTEETGEVFRRFLGKVVLAVENDLSRLHLHLSQGSPLVTVNIFTDKGRKSFKNSISLGHFLTSFSYDITAFAPRKAKNHCVFCTWTK